MDDGRKKLKICLVLMLLAAITAGVIYYCRYMPRSGERVNEGTLIVIDTGNAAMRSGNRNGEYDSLY